MSRRISNFLIAAILALSIFHGSHTPIANAELSFQLAQQGSVSQEPPFIANALWLGRNLVVVGKNFDEGTVILVDGIQQKTEPDPYNPTLILISRKAKKRLVSDQIVEVQLRNGDGALSQQFPFYTGVTISFTDAGKTIKLRIGEKFLLRLADSPAVCSLLEPDPSIISRLDDELPPITGARAWYRAEQSGQTNIWASCSIPCSPPSICPGGGPAVVQTLLRVK